MADHQRPTLCEVDGCENPAQYQCLNCEDDFCIRCKEKHQGKRKAHKFVIYSERMKRICKKHTENKYLYWCKICSEPCCGTCAITSHNGHTVVEIEDAICDKKENVKRDLGGPFRVFLTQWKNLLHKAKQTKTAYEANMFKLDQDLVAHAKRLHAAIDKSLAKIRRKLRKISEKKEETLQAQEKSINDKYEQFKRNIEQLEELVQISDISLLENMLDITDMEVLPVLTRPSPPSYTPGNIDDQTIFTMIGNLDSFVGDLTKEISVDVGNNRPAEPFPRASVTPLLSTPVVVSSFRHEYAYDLDYVFGYPYIASTTSSGQAWVTTDWRHIHLMYHYGDVLDIIDTGFDVNSFTTTVNEDVLITGNCCITSASKEASSWNVNTLFETQYDPQAICSLRNGDVVVTSGIGEHRVIQYSIKGAVVHEFDASLFSDPCAVAVNKVNVDLYVCDGGKVLVFGKDNTLRYTYTGFDGTSFNPWDVSTDNNDRILITDNNNKIHILDKEGSFLQYLQYPGLKNPLYVSVDSEGRAWIGEEKREVKIVKY